MKIHILGICGTFMGGIAAIAKELGHIVSGCDQNIYPPMSTQLSALGIDLIDSYSPEQIKLKPDIFIIGNGISRGNALLEEILEQNLTSISAPQWLYENVLRHRQVIAIAGTHGKTTSTAMMTYVLSQYAQEHNQPSPGYLIGGVCNDFAFSAKLGERYFVIEADEYDCAFFDKRSKFIHYHPQTLILNNLEFDHADIFTDLQAIETSFHHLVRTLPKSAQIIVNKDSASLIRVINRGCYSSINWFNDEDNWFIKNQNDDDYFICHKNIKEINLSIPKNIIGKHNRENLLAVTIACSLLRDNNIPIAKTLEYIKNFKGVKRRLELRGSVAGIEIYDDFAHHPSAIFTTINALREKIKKENHQNAKIIAVLEPRSNTMKMGVFTKELPDSLINADFVFGYAKNLGWDLDSVLQKVAGKTFNNINSLIDEILKTAKAGDVILGMSNGGFDGFYEKLIKKISADS